MAIKFGDTVNKVTESWASLSRSRKITVASGFGIVLALLAGIFFAGGEGTYSYLYTGLTMEETAEIISSLEAAKIPYRVSPDNTAILVPTLAPPIIATMGRAGSAKAFERNVNSFSMRKPA